MQETDVQHCASLSEFKEFQVICVGADVVFFPDYATFYAPSKTLMHCVWMSNSQGGKKFHQQETSHCMRVRIPHWKDTDELV